MLWPTGRTPGCLVLIEIHREDIRSLPDLLNLLRREIATLLNPV